MVADDLGFFAALTADALAGGSGDDLVDALQMHGEFVAARVLVPRVGEQVEVAIRRIARQPRAF